MDFRLGDGMAAQNRVSRGALTSRAPEGGTRDATVADERADDGRYEPHGIQVLTLIGTRVARITAFNDPSLVSTCNLAHTVPTALADGR